MHLLPCPNCQTQISVSPSQAGDRTNCPECQTSVPIPKLGDLRQLPRAEASADDESPGNRRETEVSSLRRGGFVILALVAAASLVVAAFCGIRWSLVDVQSSTEEHIAIYRDAYAKLSGAELIREFEDMEKVGFELARPYGYKVAEVKRTKWGRNASIAGGIGAVALLGAFVLAGTGRRNQG